MQEANVPFEMMLYPGYAHAIRGQNISPHLMECEVSAFWRRTGSHRPE